MNGKEHFPAINFCPSDQIYIHYYSEQLFVQ